MFATNEYFDGCVKSIGFESNIGNASVGVMARGDYTFDTTTVEHMSLVSGQWKIKRINDNEFIEYKVGDKVTIPANTSFDIQVSCDSAYLCEYS